MSERRSKIFNVGKIIFDYPKQNNVYKSKEKINNLYQPKKQSSETKFEISDTSAFVRVEKKKDSNSIPSYIDIKEKNPIEEEYSYMKDSIKFYSYTFPELTEGKETKKLSNQAYHRLFDYLIDELKQGKSPEFLKGEHPQVEDLKKLPGTIYFLKVSKGTRRPPRIGFQFRSYSECHYTTIDRENPIICKVKEFICPSESQSIWRLYHYYSGNKRRKEKKRKREDDDFESNFHI